MKRQIPLATPGEGTDKEAVMRKHCYGWLALISLLFLMPDVVGAQAFVTPMGEPLWSPTREQRRLSREEAVAKYNYCPTGGCVVRLERVDLKPSTVPRGKSVSLTTTYTILTPEQVAIPVTITREIYYRGKSLGRTKSVDSRNLNGTYSQEIDFSLPANAEPGLYTLVTKVSTGYGYDLKSTDFMVQ